MEYADGGDLNSEIKRWKEQNDPFKEDEILHYFTQICLALKHIHDWKTIHWDLKSQNVFLTKSWIVKLGDFGIAWVFGSTKENALTVVGTPYYLSPEIVENKPYSFQSDIWSLGILLYEMCCLEPPFNGRSIHELALKIVKANYKDPGPKFSQNIWNLLRCLLNPEQTERPSVNHILKLPFIADLARQLLSDDDFISEFSHTVLHNKNTFAQTAKLLEESRQAESTKKKEIWTEWVSRKPQQVEDLNT